jgi:two-component system chemotaxis response regulator CheY
MIQKEKTTKSILLVEDSAATRALIRAVIEEMGDFDTIEAGSGFEALKLLPTQEFDLIITDINMPDINGLELINFVKNNPRYSHLPLIIVTTERSEEDRKRGMALGAMAYITKPFKADELQEVVKKAIIYEGF